MPAPILADWAAQEDAASRADAIAYTTALLPDSGLDTKTLVAIAERAVKFDPASWSYRETLGAALYRAGKHKEAVKELNESMRLRDGGGTNWQSLFRAMAHHRLGDKAKAREWFDKAKLDKDADWQERLIYTRLRQEAATLLGVQP